MDANVESGRLLDKATVTLYEDIQEFVVADRASDGQVIGCGALHVMWEDLAEIRTIAVDESCQGEGVGYQIVEVLLARARELGVRPGLRAHLCGEILRPARLRGDQRARPPLPRSTPNCSAPMTRAWPSSSTLTA